MEITIKKNIFLQYHEYTQATDYVYTMVWRKEINTVAKQTWVCISVPPLSSCIHLGKLPKLSRFQKNIDNSTYSRELLWELKAILCVEPSTYKADTDIICSFFSLSKHSFPLKLVRDTIGYYSFPVL